MLGESVEMSAVTAEVTRKLKHLDEITDAVIRHGTAVHLRKRPAGIHVALVQLSMADANKSIKIGMLQVGWLVFPM